MGSRNLCSTGTLGDPWIFIGETLLGAYLMILGLTHELNERKILANTCSAISSFNSDLDLRLSSLFLSYSQDAYGSSVTKNSSQYLWAV